jgi:RecA/RadA recombinase
MPLAAAPIARVMTLPFGILMLDWRTKGGAVVNRVNRLWGRKSTFKTTLCLRLVRSAQRHCRHCKHVLVRRPNGGRVDCRCPNPRWRALNETEDFGWLSSAQVIQLSHGMAPEGAEIKNVQGHGRVMALRCPPPAHLPRAKARDIVLTETYRCEPMRSLYCDSEKTIDEAWARANGVDTENIELIGATWAEQNLASIEETTISKEFDLVVIDSTSMLEPTTEKTLMENEKVAQKARLLGRFMARHIASSFDGGLTSRYAPTVITTSQVATKGIGGGSHAYLDATDGNKFEHGLSLDLKMFEAGYEFNEAKQAAIYGKFGFEVRKSKIGASVGASGEIKFWLRSTPEHPTGDSDDLNTMLTYARSIGQGFALDGSGREKLKLFSPYFDGGEMAFSRIGDSVTFLREHEDVYDDLRRRVMDKLLASDADLRPAGEVSDEPRSGAEAAMDV